MPLHRHTARRIVPLSPAERKRLKSEAHHLDPVVTIGDAGLTPAVIAEADRALTAHGLIKVRVHGDDRDARHAFMSTLCGELGCEPVQMIGKLLVVYRPRPEPASSASRGPYVPKRLRSEGIDTAPRKRPAPRKSPTKAGSATGAASGRKTRSGRAIGTAGASSGTRRGAAKRPAGVSPRSRRPKRD